jgi:AcrR family transcriptional regulator
MKISKKKQQENKIKIIETAIDLMIENTYEKTTMRSIAKACKISDATIYNYFPTKEKIIWGYIYLRQEQAIKKLETIDSFSEFSVQEKIHTYFETILEGYLLEKEFMPTVFKLTHQSFLTHSTEIVELNTLFCTQIKLFLNQAIHNKEIPDQPINGIITHLILDLYFIIFFYWLKDSSEGHEKTTELIDLVLNIMMGVLKEKLISKFLNIGAFILRHHVFSQIQSLIKGSVFDSFKEDLKGFIK